MPPELFIDRSLGGIAVPEFLRSAWPARVHTLDEVFGTGKVEDTRWMELVDEQGWIAVCKDARIRTRRGERELMSQGSLRVFCLANGNLRRDEMVARFRSNLPAMLEQIDNAGPWLCALYASHIASLKLYGPMAP